MVNYKISEDAKIELILIYRRGVRDHGEAQADKYYEAFNDRFEQLTEQPYLYPNVDNFRAGYRRDISVVDSTYHHIED